jgi:acyl carrier protein
MYDHYYRQFSIEIPDDEADKITSVEDAVVFIASHPHAR